MDRRYPWGLLNSVVGSLVLITACEYALAQGPFVAYEKVLPSVVRIKVEGVTEGGRIVANYGTGFFVGSEGHILTAFHVIGKDNSGEVAKWAFDPDGKERVRISVERLGPNKTLSVVEPASVINSSQAHDLAVLRVNGDGYPAVVCRDERLPHGTSIKGMGYRRPPAAVADIISGYIVPGDVREIGERYRIVAASQPGHSGGPLFNDYGEVVAMITSGSRSTAATGETYATPIEWTMGLLSIATRCRRTASKVTPDLVEQPSALVRERIDACVQSRTKELIDPLTPFSGEGATQSEGGGLEGRGNHQERWISFRVPPGYEIVPPIKVSVLSSNGSSGHEGPHYSDDGTGRVVVTGVKIWSRSPDRLFGPEAWYHARIEGVMRRILDEPARTRIATECRQQATRAN